MRTNNGVTVMKMTNTRNPEGLKDVSKIVIDAQKCEL